jgi:hypothetical protein
MMSCFGKLCKFLITIGIRIIKTCFWILLVFLSGSKKVHFVECIGMEMTHQALCLIYKT